jgi:hypothetical protein
MWNLMLNKREDILFMKNGQQPEISWIVFDKAVTFVSPRSMGSSLPLRSSRNIRISPLALE